MSEKREVTVDLDNTSSRLSPIGTISSSDVGNTNAEIDFPTQAIILLPGPISDEWSLLNTIWLDVEETETNQVLVSSSRFGFYGVGDSVGEAVEDATEMLRSHIALLQEAEDTLPAYYRTQLEKLRSILDST